MQDAAGIPVERLTPMPDGSVREYDRPIFTHTEGVGRHQDPDARRVRVHPPESEVAKAVRQYIAERDSTPDAVRARARHNSELLSMCADLQRARAAEYESSASRPPALARVHAAPRRRHDRAGRRATSGTRSSSSSDDPDPEPGTRTCATPGCGATFETNGNGRPRRYCAEHAPPAARKRRQRENDRRHPERVVEREGETWSLAPECGCGGALAEADYVVGYYRCVLCGRKCPGPEALLLPDRGGKDKVRARTFVTVRNPKHGTLKCKRRRYPVTVIHADGSQETVSRAELVRRAEGVVAA